MTHLNNTRYVTSITSTAIDSRSKQQRPTKKTKVLICNFTTKVSFRYSYHTVESVHNSNHDSVVRILVCFECFYIALIPLHAEQFFPYQKWKYWIYTNNMCWNKLPQRTNSKWALLKEDSYLLKLIKVTNFRTKGPLQTFRHTCTIVNIVPVDKTVVGIQPPSHVRVTRQQVETAADQQHWYTQGYWGEWTHWTG